MGRHLRWLQNSPDRSAGTRICRAAAPIAPWAIRVNDALNAGAPCVVSRGMGAVKLIDDHNVGLSFAAGDATHLAWQLRRLATDDALYVRFCNAVAVEQAAFLPRGAAAYAADYLSVALS